MAVKNGYKQTEVGEIPEDWSFKPLVELVKSDSPICYGVVQVGRNVDGGVPIVAIKYVKEIGCANLHKTEPFLEKPYQRSRVSAGDVLISIKGTIGRVGVVPEGFNGNISRELARLRIDSTNSPQYVAQQLESASTQSRIASATVGTTRLEFSIATVKSFAIPLPPTKAEQEAIAEALSDADALIESLEHLIAKKRQIKQGAMQQLLTGQKRLPGFTGEWKEVQLRKCLLANPDYGINAAGVPLERDIPVYLRITDIDDDGRFIENGRVGVSHPLALDYVLGSDEIVFARTGASVGKTYLYKPEDGVVVFAGFLIRAKVDPKKLSSKFLLFFTQTEQYWDWVRVNSMRSGQPGINGNEYASMELLVPPTVDEQTAIAETLSDMDEEIAALEAKLSKARQLKQGMMQELLTGKTRLVWG
ncbi:restriction endonuclease subunit S [Pelagicoccus sp. SDUM812005]|uniref:restriction endonuclease subunit S n=1 Tax=Pelagicoccus sp. SDUM812005 TaxID=3041257 RepID=UPI00280C58E3|nr:restriction endonuclease subunit S [Pelagicoccus sp. SDUM812005]MDQ8180362.1 restriction endonuclease subunit S [Pelagicoccus sp. SDUM812005]